MNDRSVEGNVAWSVYDEDVPGTEPFESRMFYELCYDYRHIPITEPEEVALAFEALKAFGRLRLSDAQSSLRFHNESTDTRVLLLREALAAITPALPPVDAPCHSGICEQARCGHCSRIMRARAALEATK